MVNIKYIDGKVSNGIAYDWGRAINEWNRIAYDTMGEDDYAMRYFFHDVAVMWQVYLSARGMGKTTNVLGIGLVLHRDYGTRMGYIRNDKKDITESAVSGIFDSIISQGYIEKLYDGKYNDIKYIKTKRAFFLCKVDDDGKIVDIEEAELMHCHSLDYAPEHTKSSYVSPREDLLIYDEAIAIDGYTRENDFIALNQLLSTITRERVGGKCCRVFILANTITAETHIFHELEIYDAVQKMKVPESRIVYTRHNMPVYVEYISLADRVLQRKRTDKLLQKFGFKNTRLSSITGDTKAEIINVPHLPKKQEGEERAVCPMYIYIEQYGRRVRIRLERSSLLGEYAFCYEVKDAPKDDAVIYTLDEQTRLNQRYGVGIGDALDKYIMNLYKSGRFKYSYNDVGSFVSHYIQDAIRK